MGTSRSREFVLSAVSVIFVGVFSGSPTCFAQATVSNAARLAGRVKSRDRNAPIRERKSAINLGVKYFNGIFGGFSEGAGSTLGIEATTADKIPAVEFRATALVSTKLYRRLDLEAYIPRIGDEGTHADIWFTYSRRTQDNFFGVGELHPRVETNYALEQRSYNASLYRDFNEHLQAGIYALVANSAASRGTDDNDIPIDVLFSGNPNVVPISRWAPGLDENTKILDYGIFAEYDGRDNSQGLTRGAYLYGRVESADSLREDRVFSDYGWTGVELDARTYIPLGGDRTSLALRGFIELKDPKGGSQIPFYSLAFLGGRLYVRGFDSLRYRGNNLLALSAEVRHTIIARREDRGVDVVVIGDAGQVWGDNRSQTNPAVLSNKDFASSKWRGGFGGGVQYRHTKSLAARFDAVASKEGTRFYFSLSRGF